jgi:hypothetical protein
MSTKKTTSKDSLSKFQKISIGLGLGTLVIGISGIAFAAIQAMSARKQLQLTQSSGSGVNR